MSVDMWTGILKGDISDRKKNFHKDIKNTRNDLHEELDLMFQVEVEAIKTEIRINQKRMKATRREFQTQLKGDEAEAERGKGTRTGAGAAKRPKFDGTTSWAVFRRQFETVAEHNCSPRQEKST
jgi:ribosomal protein L23